VSVDRAYSIGSDKGLLWAYSIGSDKGLLWADSGFGKELGMVVINVFTDVISNSKPLAAAKSRGFAFKDVSGLLPQLSLDRSITRLSTMANHR
jgi:hypothetical protein